MAAAAARTVPDKRDDVGAVGGRLVYPDGRLQEAGGLVFRDGSAAKFGYGDREPDFPLFTVPREVDYCSGCLLAFRRDFFLESGGFDPEYGFGFYEDTDFCFRVRALGRVVLYEPESVIVHVEGASAGTDLTQGAKRFQAVNASLFTERWQTALAHQHERPAELDREALHQLARRRETPMTRSAFVSTYSVPRPHRDSGSKRLFDLMRFLRARGWDVTFVAATGIHDEVDARRLRRLGITVYDAELTECRDARGVRAIRHRSLRLLADRRADGPAVPSAFARHARRRRLGRRPVRA